MGNRCDSGADKKYIDWRWGRVAADILIHPTATRESPGA